MVYNTHDKGFSIDNIHFWPTLPTLVAALAPTLELKHPCLCNSWQFLWQTKCPMIEGYPSHIPDVDFVTDDSSIQALSGASSSRP